MLKLLDPNCSRISKQIQPDVAIDTTSSLSMLTAASVVKHWLELPSTMTLTCFFSLVYPIIDNLSWFGVHLNSLYNNSCRKAICSALSSTLCTGVSWKSSSTSTYYYIRTCRVSKDINSLSQISMYT